jgi:hypothetical protein
VKFAEAVGVGAANPREAHQPVSDVTAEYQLRGLEPPPLNEIPEWPTLRAAIDQAREQMSQEQMDEVGEEIIAGYAQVKEGEH